MTGWWIGFETDTPSTASGRHLTADLQARISWAFCGLSPRRKLSGTSGFIEPHSSGQATIKWFRRRPTVTTHRRHTPHGLPPSKPGIRLTTRCILVNSSNRYARYRKGRRRPSTKPSLFSKRTPGASAPDTSRPLSFVDLGAWRSATTISGGFGRSSCR